MAGGYMPQRSNVLARTRAPGESSIRDALAEGLASVQGSMPDLAAADALCMSVGTLRNIRNRTNTASLKIASDAAHCTDGKFIAPWLAKLNLRAVPINATCDTDEGACLKLARFNVHLMEALDDGSLSIFEARGMLDDCDAAQAVIDRIRRVAALTVAA